VARACVAAGWGSRIVGRSRAGIASILGPGVRISSIVRADGRPGVGTRIRNASVALSAILGRFAGIVPAILRWASVVAAGCAGIRWRGATAAVRVVL
jgi:hypothetical protein